MREISNKTLAFLLAIAIVVSLSGAFISLSKLSLFTPPATGLAATGILNFSITESTSVSVTRSIEFGSGFINESTTTYVILESNNSNYGADNGNGSWSWSARGLQYFLVENSGNTNVSLNLSANVSAATFIGGGAGALSDPIMEYAVTFELGDACNGTTSQATGWTTLNNTYNSTACRLFYYNATSDKLNISVRVGIPQDVSLGGRDALITFDFYKYA